MGVRHVKRLPYPCITQHRRAAQGAAALPPSKTFLLDHLVPLPQSTIDRVVSSTASSSLLSSSSAASCLQDIRHSFRSSTTLLRSLAFFLYPASSTLILIYPQPPIFSHRLLDAFPCLVQRPGYYLPVHSIVRPSEPRRLGRAFTTFLQSPL